MGAGVLVVTGEDHSVLSRRDLLRGGIAATALAGAGRWATAPAEARVPANGSGTVDLPVMSMSGVAGAGYYLYFPFKVPHGVNRIDVAVGGGGPNAAIGAGLFDQRGVNYQTGGFRGIYGQERSTFFVAPDAASEAFIPGPIHAGSWTVCVPVFTVEQPTTVTVAVRLSFGPSRPAFTLGPEVGVVNPRPGWYRGDLHCHTTASSDAWSSRSAMTPAQWADACRRSGLDFVAMTDHNVISQNFHLGRDAGQGVLLMPGEEMTNWFWGHATVSGISPGEWLDWRQLPVVGGTGSGLPASHVSAPPGTVGTIAEFMAAVNEMGAYASAAHPYGATLLWRFFGDAAADPKARTHGIEVWTGPFQPDDEASLRAWDSFLQQGWRIFANGGSDLHGVRNTGGTKVGLPTTVVYAESLSKRHIVAALKAGRSFVTKSPAGAELYLAATGPRRQRQIVGGTISGRATDVVNVTVSVVRGIGKRLSIIANGGVAKVANITASPQDVTVAVPVGGGGYVPAELRGEPTIDASSPMASSLDMEAFTNPIFVVNDLLAAPTGHASGGHLPAGAEDERAAALPVAAAAIATPALAELVSRSHDHSGHWHDHDHDHGPPRRSGRPASPSAARTVTLTELRWHAGCARPLTGPVVIEAQVTSTEPTVVTRWVPDCCAPAGRAVDVIISATSTGDGEPLRTGAWIRAVGTLVMGPGAHFDGLPELQTASVRRLDHEPSRYEIIA